MFAKHSAIRLILATAGWLALAVACTTGAPAAPTIAPTAVVNVTAVPRATTEPTAVPPTMTVPIATATAIPPTATSSPPSVTVADQAVTNNSVTITEAISPGAGWLAVRRDDGGEPGIAIGFAPLTPGRNENVTVPIDPAQTTAILYAGIHIDDGVIGDFEFPYYDPPLETGGAPVLSAFNVSGAAAATDTPPPPTDTPPPPTDTPPPATEAPPARVFVSIEDFRFSPAQLTVPVGTTVVWTSNATARHTVTAADGSFGSATMAQGDVFEFTFMTPGTFVYFCRFHGSGDGQGMAGTVTVTQE